MADKGNWVGRVADFASAVLRMAETRLEMLGIELQRERDAIVRQLKLGMTSVISAGVAGLSVVLWVALSLPPDQRVIALGALTLTFVGISVGAVISDGGSTILASSQTAILAPPSLAAFAGTKAGTDHIVKIAAV